MVKTVPFNAEEFFTEADDQIALLVDALESGDPKYAAHALGIVARARGITNVSRATGLSREALYRSLSSSGNPTLTTVMDVMRVLGLKLTAEKEVV